MSIEEALIGDTLTKTVHKANLAEQFCKGNLPDIP